MWSKWLSALDVHLTRANIRNQQCLPWPQSRSRSDGHGLVHLRRLIMSIKKNWHLATIHYYAMEICEMGKWQILNDNHHIKQEWIFSPILFFYSFGKFHMLYRDMPQENFLHTTSVFGPWRCYLILMEKHGLKFVAPWEHSYNLSQEGEKSKTKIQRKINLGRQEDEKKSQNAYIIMEKKTSFWPE